MKLASPRAPIAMGDWDEGAAAERGRPHEDARAPIAISDWDVRRVLGRIFGVIGDHGFAEPPAKL